MTVSSSSKEALTEFRASLSDLPLRDGEQEFLQIATQFIKRHGDRFRLSHRSEPLSSTEAAALNAVGVLTEAEPANAAPLVQTVTNHAALVATALPLKEAARQLGVSDGRLRQRIAERTLVAVHGPDGRALRIPLFQLTPEGELPGLRPVLKAIRPDLRPIQVAAFFTTPQSDLEGPDGEAMTPVAWLLAGQDPEPVREIALQL
jgi:hypothetical protein